MNEPMSPAGGAAGSLSPDPQKRLSARQIEAFYHDQFVTCQVGSFMTLLPGSGSAGVVLDVGGGCGYFAEALAQATGRAVRVLDMDGTSVQACLDRNIPAEQGDALKPQPRGDEEVVCFNLVLHHLVGATDAATLDLQSRALAAWRGRVPAVFVDEYIYDAYVGELAGWLIYTITSSRLLSALASTVSRWVPSLRANTFGVGVRFRSRAQWDALFRTLGYRVAGHVRGPEERVSLARRLLCIRSCRRDSFLLVSER